jgi:hypothetical protein
MKNASGSVRKVVDRVTLGEHAHRAECVDVVVCSANAQVGNHQTLSHKLELARNDELHPTEGDLQATLVNEACDRDKSIFERGFVQVSVSCGLVRERAAAGQRVAGGAECNTVTTAEAPPVNALFRTAAALTCLV